VKNSCHDVRSGLRSPDARVDRELRNVRAAVFSMRVVDEPGGPSVFFDDDDASGFDPFL